MRVSFFQKGAGRVRHCAVAALVAAVCAAFGGAAGWNPVPLAHAQANALRPEVGKPLQAAAELLRAQKYKEAAARVREADAVANKTANESFVVERMRGSVAMAAGDHATAIRSFEAQIDSGRLAPAEQLKVIEALAGEAYRAKDYKKAGLWASRYAKEGGPNPQIRELATQSQYLSGDYAVAARDLQAQVQADLAAGRTPSEERLQMLANAQLRLNDHAGYVATLEKLVACYPKKPYWADLIARLRRKPGFSDRLSLDVYRLQSATGNLTTTADYMEAVQLALQAGFAGEAKRFLDEGYAAGALGKGPEAERHGRLRELTLKRLAEARAGYASAQGAAEAAKDGNALVSLGYATATGDAKEQGVALIERGVAKGGLRHAEDAKLLLGLAQAQAGQKQKALQTLHAVRGNDGTADLARLWVLELSR